jgi:hypothetical protein
MAAFASEFEFNDKLKKTLVNDVDHLGIDSLPVSDRSGPHIFLIHKALNAWASVNRPGMVLTSSDADFSTETFGAKTKQLVIAYKTAKNITNYQGLIDGYVGKKTVAALDRELLPRDVNPPPTPTKSIVDIVVKFVGAHPLVGNRFFEGEFVFASQLITPYLATKSGRTLHRFGQVTVGIEQEAASVVVGMRFRIKSALENNTPGIIAIYGSSSGGRATLDLARSLTGDGVPLAYVAAVDAAFFPNSRELTNRPDNLIGEPTVTPRFAGAGIGTAQFHSFYQRAGNHSKTRPSGIHWTSKMAGEEIHGMVIGSRDRDMTRETVARAGHAPSDDSLHIELSGVAIPVVEREIAALLNNV